MTAPPCTEDVSNVYERVHAILSDLPAIGKNSNAPGAMGGYAFRGIEDITAALKPLLKKHGVFMVPTVVDRQESVRTTSQQKALYVVDLLVRFTFYAAQVGHPLSTASFSAEVWGQGSDSGDKATQKAMTSAFKSMLSITFCISDAENDSEGHDVPETTSIDPAWRDRVKRLAEDVKSAGLSDWVKEQNFVWPWAPADCDIIEEKLSEPL